MSVRCLQLSGNVKDTELIKSVACHLSERLTPQHCLPTDGAGRAGRAQGRLGTQPGPAGPVHRLTGKGADQNGWKHEEVPH